MATPTPLLAAHESRGAELIAYGEGDTAVAVVATFGELDFEYAALRKACVLVDLPHRATIEITGDDRLPFLNNMVTQKVSDLQPGASRRTFWLSRKGRIDADLRLLELGDRMLADVDVHAVARTLDTLGAYVITEDVELTDASDRLHRMALHGPTAASLLDLASSSETISALEPGRAATVTIANTEVIVEREDSAGVPGFELVVPTEHAEAVRAALVELGRPDPESPDPSAPAAKIKLRESGWLAVNTARIEAGTPVFNIDFTTESLPAECGEATLNDRVDFTKGCYLGQEVVARMHSLGKPKQVLVGLKPTEASDPQRGPNQPLGGSPVLLPDDGSGNPIGGVTSSTVSPMLGGEPICFAVIKQAHATEGTELTVPAEGELITVRVQADLRFVK